MHQPIRGHRPEVDPSAYVHRTAVLIGQVRIGAQASIWPHVTLRGDDGPIVVAACTSIQDGSVVHMTEGRSVTVVGARVTVGHNVILHGCTIEDDCLIGMGAILLDGAVIERGSIVGAGALVAPGRRVAAGTVVIGNPSRVLRTCTDADRESIAYSWRNYVARAAEYAEAERG